MPVFNTANRNRLADSLGTAFDGGTLEIRTGAAPASDAADAGTLLATITLPADCFAAAAAGAAAKAGTWSATVSASGTAGHGRFKSSAGPGTLKMDVSVGQGSGELSLDNNVLVSGGTVTVSTFTITQPAS